MWCHIYTWDQTLIFTKTEYVYCLHIFGLLHSKNNHLAISKKKEKQKQNRNPVGQRLHAGDYKSITRRPAAAATLKPPAAFSATLLCELLWAQPWTLLNRIHTFFFFCFYSTCQQLCNTTTAEWVKNAHREVKTFLSDLSGSPPCVPCPPYPFLKWMTWALWRPVSRK